MPSALFAAVLATLSLIPGHAAWAALATPALLAPAPELPASPLVQRIQELLIEFGDYHGAPDGRVDDDTRDAIRAYQRRSGIEADGRATEPLLTHMEFTTQAIALGARLDAARAAQMQAAAEKLQTLAATRELLGTRPQAERADPTRDASACFAIPTAECLLHEAAESAKAVFDVRFRDWTLGQIVIAEARAGLADDAFATAARISDPRLVIAALRDIAIGRADVGDITAAIAAAGVIPDDAARAKALVAIAKAQARAGADADLDATLTQLEALAPGLPAAAAPVELFAELSLYVGRLGSVQTDRLVADARALIEPSLDADEAGAKAALAAVLAGLGRMDEAQQLLGEIADAAQRRVVFGALANAVAGTGDVTAAIGFAANIAEPQFRTTTLATVAATTIAAGTPEGADRVLDEARLAADEVDHTKPYSRATAVAAVARAMAGAGAIERAEEAIAAITDGRLRAEALWSLAVAKTAAGDGAGGAAARAQSFAEAAKLTSALDRVWLLCGSATVSNRAGDSANARDAFRRAVDEARAIGDPWTRSQAIIRVAAALESLR